MITTQKNVVGTLFMRILFKSIFLVSLFCVIVQAEVKEQTLEKNKGDKVLILASTGDLFDQAKTGLKDELNNEYDLSFIEVDKKLSTEHLQKIFSDNVVPKVIVLIGNKAIKNYRKFVESQTKKPQPPQIIAIMALDIARATEGIPNVQGIAYETPMISAIVMFRRVLNRPLSKVGVIYRKSFGDFVRNNADYCRREQIELQSILIDDKVKDHKNEIAKGLDTLLNQKQVQAIWIPNDNIILKPELLITTWLPLLNKSNIPVIVGVESLVKPELNFGTYAVIPEAKALGEQAAELIVDLKENNWNYSGIKIYPAISMYSVLNLEKAIKITGKNDFRTSEITKIFTRENTR